MFDCADSDPAAVYSAVRTGDVTYGQITIKDKKKKSKMRGTASSVVVQFSLDLRLCFKLRANIRMLMVE